MVKEKSPWRSEHRYSVRVSPQMANRIVESARSVLNQFLPDIYIHTDHMKGVNSGKWVSLDLFIAIKGCLTVAITF